MSDYEQFNSNKIINGYVVFIKELYKLIKSSSYRIIGLLDTIPLASNYNYDKNIEQISFNKIKNIQFFNNIECVYQHHDIYHNCFFDLRTFANMKNINGQHCVIISEDQYNAYVQGLEEDPEVKLSQINKCTYDSSKLNKYLYKIFIHELTILQKSMNHLAQNLLKTKVKILDTNILSHYVNDYVSEFSLQTYIDQYSRHDQYWLFLSDVQIDALKQAAFEDSSIKLFLYVEPDNPVSHGIEKNIVDFEQLIFKHKDFSYKSDYKPNNMRECCQCSVS